jgi:Ca2+-binding RTX toxin-like protein
METIDLAARGGADTITVNDLTGTDVKNVNIDAGGADGQLDTIVINATAGNDVITVTNDGGFITVSGLAANVTISGFEPNDRIVINGLGGDDVILASGLTGMQLTANGGDGNDILIGSAGNDVLTGGPGDDVLIGGGGFDVLDGGSGDNVIINAVIAPLASIGGAAESSNAAFATAAALLGQSMASSFVSASESHSTLTMADPSTVQHPLLAPPHAS